MFSIGASHFDTVKKTKRDSRKLLLSANQTETSAVIIYIYLSFYSVSFPIDKQQEKEFFFQENGLERVMPRKV